MRPITRFAPSPTGRLHLGHVRAAAEVWRSAAELGATVLLRIEDIDPERCRPDYTAAIFEDLAWLGFAWPQPVRQQSQHMADYKAALARLQAMGLAYPCFCSRKTVAAALAADPAPAMGAEGPLYPGTCRTLSPTERQRRIAAGERHSWRLDSAATAARHPGLVFTGIDGRETRVDPRQLGDAVIARHDIPASYHLSVTVDDALQGVTHIVRGADLAAATHTHRLLQAALGLPAPLYRHHPLVLDAGGAKLSKRDGAEGVYCLREAGCTPQQVLAMAGLIL